jgi:hypothetical protein
MGTKGDEKTVDRFFLLSFQGYFKKGGKGQGPGHDPSLKQESSINHRAGNPS